MGRITALDMFVISNNGPYDANGDVPSSGRIVSLLYQREAMRWRGATILTNTPPRSAQSSPGGMQGIAIMEPVIAKAARKLGLDQVAIRRINCPEGKAPVGPAMRTTASGLMQPAHSSRKRSTAVPSSSNGRSESRALRNEAARRCAALEFR